MWVAHVRESYHPYAYGCFYERLLKRYVFIRLDYDKVDWVYLVSTWVTQSGVTAYPEVC
ncbi:hypothetical protein [Pyrobaculum aerophilum]|uniref:hypothetical protein n=1 Tax=Pyrobaculum aerophilum TaxID=13773 RepID=UPI0023F3A9E3|nr:hypothetical protein [Pyrobaculum aerophilum]MCX8136429.1 hypothetical protein [Pyrobaculum aerophilum]